MLQDQTKPIAHEKAIDVGVTIDHFEDRFRNLHKEIRCQLIASDIDTLTFIDSLTLLPMKLRKEYEKSITESLSFFVQKRTIQELFLQLNPLFSFIDYGLLEHIIKLYGSDLLNKDMKTYCNDMQLFMKQTTIKELIDYLPGQKETPPNFEVLKAKIGEDASKCTLERINNLRKRFCAQARLSEIIFCLIALEDSNSFIVSWLVPSILVPDLIESAKGIKESFFDMENIISLSVGNQWLYNPKLTQFGAQLKQQYQQSLGSPSPVEWIPSPTKKIFRLAMIQRERVQRGHIEDRFVQMTISGRVDDILHAKSPVELEHIFRNAIHGSEVILIEGAPGSGKSTLTVHICQRWGKGELFQQFTVVILVQLRDPAVQRAQTIADLLPVENVAVAQELATELTATNGCGVLWVLDGWDELPTHLQQDSIFCNLLPPKPSEEKLKEIEEDPFYAKYVTRGHSNEELWIMYLQNNPQVKRLLNECSVVVTSRPISSGDLHPVVSSRIEVLGFTPEEQRQYFTECLKGDTKAFEALLEKIQENPVVQSICYLPLNAAFVVHSFKFKGQLLANTVYEIYSTVILSCIQRHFEREGRGHDLPREIASLDDLSRNEAVREPFQHLCELAYRGVIENKVAFSSSDLPQGSNTLSLLQAIESFLRSGKSVFYNFLHLSIQEVLSAYYIATWLSDSEQVSQFQQLFNQPRFAAVFQFYSTITKLKSPGIRQVIDQIVEAKSKPLLVSLLNCLYEAQDHSLCLYVTEKLGHKLDLGDTSLSPLDCLSISFFLSSVTGKEIIVNLNRCYIHGLGTKCLTKYLGSDVDHVSKVTINLDGSRINTEGVSHTCIIRNVYFIAHLYLSHNPIGDTGASLISEAVRETVVLKTLILSSCGITSRGAKDLSRALAHNSCLEKLDIGGNNLGDKGASVISEAVRETVVLKTLILSSCGITSRGAKDISRALAHNSCLEKLDIGGNNLGDKGASVISEAVRETVVLKTLILSSCGITSRGAKDLSRALTHNSCLEKLDIGDNDLGDKGASVISEAVRETVVLKTLILSSCGITSRGAKDISRALAHNSSLEKLDFGGNNLGDEGISHVAEALKQNAQLKELWIGGCRMADKGAASLASALSVNNSLKVLQIGDSKGALTERGLSAITQSLTNNSEFMKLTISSRYDSIISLLKFKVNQTRIRNGLQPIEIEGEYCSGSVGVLYQLMWC